MQTQTETQSQPVPEGIQAEIDARDDLVRGMYEAQRQADTFRQEAAAQTKPYRQEAQTLSVVQRERAKALRTEIKTVEAPAYAKMEKATIRLQNGDTITVAAYVGHLKAGAKSADQNFEKSLTDLYQVVGVKSLA